MVQAVLDFNIKMEKNEGAATGLFQINALHVECTISV